MTSSQPPPTQPTTAEDLAQAIVHIFDVNQAADWQDATTRAQALTLAARRQVVATRAWIEDSCPPPILETLTNEIQHIQITGTPTAGQFTLTYNNATTTGLAYNPVDTAIQTALEALTTIGTGNVTVTQTTSANDFDVEFIGTLAELNLPLMTADSSALTPAGAAIAITVVQDGGSVPAGS
jgi:hypothetical protein